MPSNKSISIYLSIVAYLYDLNMEIQKQDKKKKYGVRIGQSCTLRHLVYRVDTILSQSLMCCGPALIGFLLVIFLMFWYTLGDFCDGG